MCRPEIRAKTRARRMRGGADSEISPDNYFYRVYDSGEAGAVNKIPYPPLADHLYKGNPPEVQIDRSFRANNVFFRGEKEGSHC